MKTIGKKTCIRGLIYLLVLTMIWALTACSPNPTPNESLPSQTDSNVSDSQQSGDNSDVSVSDPGDSSQTDVTQSGVASTTAGNGNNGTTAGSSDKKTTTTTQKSSSGSGSTSSLKAMDDGLDFGGATFTKTVCGPTPAGTTRRIAAFEKAYNCKLKIIRLDWEKFNSQVAMSISAGTPYDICGMDNYFFPENVISMNLFEPLNDYFTDADVYGNAANKKDTGIDLKLCDYYKVDGKIYGIATHSVSTNFVGSVYPMVLYYNKKMMSEIGFTGAKDPQAMYKAGKWTWDEFEKMANEIMLLSEPGKFVVGRDFIDQGQHILWSNDVHITTTSGGKVKGNLSDPSFINALTRMQKWFNDKNSFVNAAGTDGQGQFVAGNQYMYVHASATGPLGLMPQVEKSAAFGKKIANLGVVPFPTGPDNKTKAVACTQFSARGAAKGSKDPRAVVAYAKFQDLFYELDPMAKTNKYQYSKEDKALLDSLADNVVLPVANYKTSSMTTYGILWDIFRVAQGGGDFSKTISDNKDAFDGCINTALKQ